MTRPINLIYSENNVYVSYFKRIENTFEIWVIESYDREIVTSFWDTLNRYYFATNTIKPKDYSQDELDFIYI